MIALTYNLRTVPELLFKLFIPIGLAPMPAYSITATLGGIAALILLFVIAVRVRPATVRELAFGLGWFILFLAPSLVFVNPNGRTAFDYLEHRAYLPAVGILIFISGWIDRHDQLQLARKAPVLLSLVAFLFGIYSFSYAKKYKDPVVYFNMAVEGNPGSAVALYCRGTVLFYENKDYRSAIYDFDRVLDLSPGYAQAYLNRGFCKEQTGDIEGAINDYKSAFKADSTTYEPLAALAFLYTSQGADSLALPLYSYAITVNPEFAVGYFQRALIKMRLQDLNGAREDLDHAIASDRDYAEAYLYRGTVMHMLKDPGQALSDFDQAISMDATLVAAYVNRGVLKFETGDQEGALADLDQAVNLDNRSTDALVNRGRVLYFLGRKEAAKSDWIRAAGLGSEEAQKLLSII
jgi:tetratricopeptide (TPR) repeat protein